MAGYLKLGSISGKSTDPEYPGWIPILSLDVGGQRVAPGPSNSPIQSKLSNDATFIANVAAVSYSALLSQMHAPATLALYDSPPGAPGTWGLEVRFTEAVVTAVSTSGGSITFSINFTKMDWHGIYRYYK